MQCVLEGELLSLLPILEAAALCLSFLVLALLTTRHLLLVSWGGVGQLACLLSLADIQQADIHILKLVVADLGLHVRIGASLSLTRAEKQVGGGLVQRLRRSLTL